MEIEFFKKKKNSKEEKGNFKMEFCKIAWKAIDIFFYISIYTR